MSLIEIPNASLADGAFACLDTTLVMNICRPSSIEVPLQASGDVVIVKGDQNAAELSDRQDLVGL